MIVLYLVALLAPWLAPFDPTAQAPLTERWTAPSFPHLLGTDHLARDVLSRTIYGARVSLSVGLVAVGISTTLGVLVGATAGYLGGWVDGVLMRVVDVVVAFPRLVLLIAVVALFQPSLVLVMIVVGLTEWPTTARLVRGEVLGLREAEFVHAARALGYSGPRVLFRHVIPNAMGPAIVAATLGVGHVIVLEAGLSFLGLGVRPPTPSWGSMVADGLRSLESAWWVSTFPGLAIVIAVVAFNAVGDGLREAFDPRGRGSP
jgi:peptide/nickel transport system permease protein